VILDFALAYLAFLICTVAVMRAARARNRAEREADARAARHHDQHRRTR
jgi:hypothetical protein